MQARPRALKNLGSSHNKELGKTGDWRVNHEKWINKWEQRDDYIEEGPSTGTYVMSADYWDWYSNRFARHVLYLSAAHRATDPRTVELPPRFPNPWPGHFVQLPPEHLWHVPAYPQPEEVQPEVPVPDQPHMDQVMYGIHGMNIQQPWVDWNAHLSQPVPEYIGWNRVGSPPPQTPPSPQGPGFGTDFDCTFTYPEGPGETTGAWQPWGIGETSRAGETWGAGQTSGAWEPWGVGQTYGAGETWGAGETSGAGTWGAGENSGAGTWGAGEISTADETERGQGRYILREECPPNEQSPYMYYGQPPKRR